MLETVDKILSITIIIFGVLQWFATPYFFPRIEESAAWFFAGGMLLILIGVLDLLRIKYRLIAAGIEYVSVSANIMLSIFWLAMLYGLYYKFLRYPASFIAIDVILASTVISLLQLRVEEGRKKRVTSDG